MYMCFVIVDDTIISLSYQIDIFLRWSNTFANDCIFLTPRKATSTLYIGQAITLTCLRRYQNIAVRLNFLIFFSFIEILLKFRTDCQDHQGGKSALRCLFQRHQRMAQIGFEPRSRRSQSQRTNHSTRCRQIVNINLIEKHCQF